MAEMSQRSYESLDWNSMLDYKDGKLFWKVDVNRRVRKGSVAGTTSKQRYSRICFKGREYKVHRIVYEMHNGCIPVDAVIDHINRDISDNRIENLRVVNQKVNSQNQMGKGVYQLPSGKWFSQIKSNGVTSYLGSFDTEVEARQSYLKAKHKMHGVTE